MGWKSVAWTSCLLPVLAGCGAVRNSTSEAPPAPMVVQREIKPVIPYIPLASAKQNQAPPPREMPRSGKFGEPMRSDDPPDHLAPLASPDEGEENLIPPYPPLPKPEIPVIPSLSPTLPEGKFSPLPVPRNPELLPAPNPPLPVPVESVPVPIPVPVSATPPSGALGNTTPTSGIPSSSGVLLPTTPPVAPVLEAIPVVPFQYTPPASPIPFSKPQK